MRSLPFRKSSSARQVLSVAFGMLIGGVTTTSAAELPPGFAETQVATDLNPTTMSFAPDGRLFLCEKQGLLRVVEGERLREEPLLDLTDRVDSWNERGLMSVCFDPDFQYNGWLYLYYTINRDPNDEKHTSSNNRVSRFTLNGDFVDPASEVVVLEIDNLTKTGWHNGGGLEFGNDGKLYISTGENANGPNAQDSSNLLGKLLRIEKDGRIPSDNPRYSEYSGKNRAIVGLGLRNPFTIAKQPESGLFYLSVVGANYEQIVRYETGVEPKFLNYGWPAIDGPLGRESLPANFKGADYYYDHGQGQGLALCGGDFYNPSRPGADAFPESYVGKFFFSDYGGWIKLIDPEAPSERLDFATTIDRPIDVAIAPDGALWYIARAGIPGGSNKANTASDNGSLWRVRWSGDVGSSRTAERGGESDLSNRSAVLGVNLPASAEGDLPATLLATGIFLDKNLTPAAALVPYSLAGTAWADGAEMQRWVGLPHGMKIGFSAQGEYNWPSGTLFVQHFEIVTNAKTGERRRLETRLLVLDESGKFGYGATYRWRPDNSDADLVPIGGDEERFAVADALGGSTEQTWMYAPRGLCFMCHTPNAGFVLGPKTHQLNGDHVYSGGKTDNQLRTWNSLQMFEHRLKEEAIGKLSRAYKIDDESASLEARVRSYLDVNCAGCHRPGGTGSEWDARFEIPLEKQGILEGIVRNNLGIEDARIVAPGDVSKSIMHARMASLSVADKMPPLTRNVVDAEALEVLRAWIEERLPSSE